MPVRKYTLDGKTMGTLDDLYDQLSTQISLPEHFGRNLDALWDVLSADVQGPFEIVWKHTEDSRKLLGKDFERVVKLLRDVEKERTDFTLRTVHN
jgi:ribonuclease inhibitor